MKKIVSQTVLYPRLSVAMISQAMGLRIPPALVTNTFADGGKVQFKVEARPS